MTKKQCSIDGCETTAKSKGWCPLHYGRWKRNGDPLVRSRPKAERTCSLDSCDRKHAALGLCSMHYQRRWKYGTTEIDNPAFHDPDEGFDHRTEWREGCLEWTGRASENGYGKMWLGDREGYAHRFAYEREHGPIPDGMYVDHSCWNRLCCNVEHLRLATPAQNSFNRSGARSSSTTGVRGVMPHGAGGFNATVTFEDARHRKWFRTQGEAEAWVLALREELNPEFAGAA